MKFIVKNETSLSLDQIKIRKADVSSVSPFVRATVTVGLNDKYQIKTAHTY